MKRVVPKFSANKGSLVLHQLNKGVNKMYEMKDVNKSGYYWMEFYGRPACGKDSANCIESRWQSDTYEIESQIRNLREINEPWATELHDSLVVANKYAKKAMEAMRAYDERAGLVLKYGK